jgi:hypothetical protein
MLKRIKYRFLLGDPRSSAEERIWIFTITKIKADIKLPKIACDSSRTTKMHDSLPLPLFSLEMILIAFGRFWKIE